MKIAVLGGSFNPIHIAHLVLADCVCKELGYDKVLFVPTYIPPHKYMSDTTCAKERLKMVDLAVEHDSRFESENYEIKSGGVSYTWDTICYLEKKYEKVLTDKIGLILGFDLAPHFDRWKGALELSQKCEIILAVRPETKNATENSCFENKATPGYDDKIENFCEKDFAFPHVCVLNPALEISSTEIRRRIAEGKSWRYLVSEEVFNYIKKRKLYGFTNRKY